jgi:filamentous hemagglutinin family protein
MSRRPAVPFRSHRAAYAALLASVSILTLVAATMPMAQARPLGGAQGSAATSATAAASAAAMAAAQQSQQSALRATQSMQAMLSAQAAARKAALAAPGTVPNGLAAGGLVPDSGLSAPGSANSVSTWINANTPTQSQNGGQTTVTVKQTAAKAILNWRSFNVGRDTSVYFDQSAGNDSSGNGWIALNRVNDPSGVPSKILGQIKSEGAVYLINRNGIIFGGSNQINVGTLLVSTLDITDSQFNYGILYQSSGDANIIAPAFTGTPGQTAALTVEAGASISATTGGKVLLFGGNVTNAGTISTPQGQAILASGDAVYLEPSTDGLRGIVANVESGLAAGYNTTAKGFVRGAAGSGWTARNDGLISADVGNITMVGQNVTQNGVLTATSSAALDGSIRLWARTDQLKTSQTSSGVTTTAAYRGAFGGTLTLGPGSLTQVRADLNSSDYLLDSTTFKASSLEFLGRTIVMQQNSEILGEAAKVTLRAADMLLVNPTVFGVNGSTYFDRPDDGSRIYLDTGSLIDVSGLQNVPLAMEKNSVPAELRSDEFADYPQLRNSALRGATIYVDRRVSGQRSDGTTWVGTAFGDVSAWLALGHFGAGELMSAGGSVRIDALGSAITRSGSQIYAAGGSLSYASGYVRTSKVLWHGHVYDIGSVTPDMVGATLFDGAFTVDHAHWGVTETYSSLLYGGHYEPGYVQGQSGGQILVTAHHAVLDGYFNVSAGIGDALRGNAAAAAGGKLTFGEAIVGAGASYDRTMPQLVVGTPSSALASDFNQGSVLSGALATTVYVRPELINDSGAKDIAINTNQTFTLNEDASITLAPGGSFNVLAAKAVINGDIRAPAGDITVIARIGNQQSGALNLNDKSLSHTITVGSNAVLDVTGLWINLSDGDTPVYSKSWLNGGNVTLSAERAWDTTNAVTGDGALTVAAGSLIDASSGGLLLANHRLAVTSAGVPLGNGGTISLIGSALEKVRSNPGSQFLPAPEASTLVAGELRAYGLGAGGSLAVAAATVQIGGDPSLTNSNLYLDPSFFQSGGFSNYRIIGWNGVNVAPNTVVEPKVKSFLLDPSTAKPTSAKLSAFAAIGFKLDQLRAPTNLTLYAPNYGASNLTTATSTPGPADVYHVGDRGVVGDIILGVGSVIRTDPGAIVDIRAARELAVYGTILAPGGTITLANDQESGIAVGTVGPDNASSTIYHRPNVTLWIDASAQLLTPGLVQTFTDTSGRSTSRTFDGGSVSLTGGNIVVQPGSVIDVSGASGSFVPSTAQGSRRQAAPQQLATSAGSITLTPGNYLYFDPTLRVSPGDASVRGASFAITPITQSSISTVLPLAYNLPAPPYADNSPTIPATGGSRIVLSDGSGGTSPIARAGDGLPAGSSRVFNVFEDSLQRAGFDDLILSTLDGVIAFHSNTDLSARRSIQLLSRYIGGDGSVTVNVSAPYVAFGGLIRDSSSTTGNGDPAASGTGTFNVNADLIDFSGTTTFGVDPSIRVAQSVSNPLLKTMAQAGFATINFNSTGDIRFNDNSPVPGSTTIAAALNTYGDVTFTAAELYPLTKTGAGFVINGYVVDTHTATSTVKNPNSTITIRSNGHAADVPLSANGLLTIAGPHIVQGGILRAPAGQITLTNATATLTANLAAAAATDIKLTAGSLTSVDLEGALVPYGTTRNGTDLIVKGLVVTTPPQKQITLNGTTIDVQAGAEVSASGGGDLATYEFVAGSGGSTDVLAGKNVFAVIPSYRGALPKDSDWANGTSLKVGNSVYLSGIPGLAAGYYTLLPGYYALLPGAFRVTVSTANSDVAPDRNVKTVMGGYLTAGYFADEFTHAKTSERWSTFLVESGDVVRSRSQYNENRLSDFLTGIAAANNVVPVRLPDEPGRIQFNATSLLTFEGIARTTSIPGGRGGQIDISSGSAILITGIDSTPVAGTLVLRADQLSHLDTESLMIGGTRSQISADGNATVLNGASVTVGALNITLDTNGTELSGTEIILVAQNSITAKSGSIIRATGTYRSTAAPDLLLDQGTTTTPTAAQKANDGAAILTVSNGAKPNFVRGNSKTGTLPAIGNVTIQDGVVLDGGNSLLIDGNQINLAFGAASRLTGKAVQLGSNHISIGDLAQATPLPGLQLDRAAVAALSRINDLTLRSRETIDLYGNFTLGLPFDTGSTSQITLDAAGLVGTSNAGSQAEISAATVNIVNTSGTAATLPTLGSGTLLVSSANTNIGGNTFVDGMSNTEVDATGSITSISSGTFDIRHGALTLQSGQLTSLASVSRIIQAPNGSLTVRGNGGTVARTANAGGARLQLIAQNIVQKGDIELPGGVVVLQSTAGSVELGSGSVTNAGGFSKNFYDVTRNAPGGRVDIVASGNVKVDAGALLDVSSDGDAGTVTVTAGGLFDLQGRLDGLGGDDFRDGAFSLDAGTVSNFDQLNAILNAASFDRERNFRIRSGDVTIGANTIVAAHVFTLSTDAGAIAVAGRIDAGGALPGSIRLSASGNVVLVGGASLDARGAAVDDAGHGGTISLETASGYIDVQAGSRIDLGAGGDTAVLNLRMPRIAGGVDANNHLNGILTGAGAVNVEAFNVYSNITTLAATGSGAGTLTFASIDADNSAFVGSFGTAIKTQLTAGLTTANAGRFHLLAGVEVESNSDLTVTNAGNAVNFANYRYKGEAGVLTLRAAGNLNINGNISDGFTTAVAATGQLLVVGAPNASSWSYRLIAGADTNAGDVRQAHQAGDVSIAAATLVRTGTGNVEVDAGRDVKFAARDSVLYTAGVGRDLTGVVAPANASYGINGGDITMAAGGNISDGNPSSAGAGGTIATAPSDELVTAWLYRQGNLDSVGVPIAGRPTSWWINYATFQQGGVGALGGGNITIRAGDPRTETSGKINNLSVVLPTTGLVNGDQLKFVAGGGDLSIEATGNINSGLFYVGKGVGDIRTNRSFGSARIVSDTNPSTTLSAANKALPIFPVLALGDARMNLIAGGDVGIQAIFNPTVTMQASGNATGLVGNPFSGFFTYSANSAVSLTSIGGKAVVYDDVGALMLTVSSTSAQFTQAQANARYTGDKVPDTESATIQSASLWPYLILPPTLKVTAINGDVGFDGGMTLFPSATGTLEFLSAGSIRVMTPTVNATSGAAVLASVTGIAISDADPLRLPNPIAPDFNMATARARLIDDPSTDYATETDVSRERLHATYLLHKGDLEPARFYALNGDINFRTTTTATAASAISIVSAKSVRLLASRDVLDLRLLAQNVNDSDLTLVRAGRDIKFTTQTGGSPINGNANSIDLVYVAGPGVGDFEAGRNINLGNSFVGIQSIGDLRNPALADQGATIVVAAGMTNVHYTDFASTYLDPGKDGGVYDALLIDAINQRHPRAPVASAAQAWAEFQRLSSDDQAILIRAVFFDELAASADHAAKTDPKNLENYAQGFAAIDTLFPTGSPRSGDIRMGSSRVATLDGGNISLLSPAGTIYLGVNQTTTYIVQGGGLQTQQAGSIYSMSYGDLLVAQAAVHTLGGGGIGMWSTTGDIDAGKGAKSRKNVVKPAYRTDMNGRTVFSPGSISTGAGIATLQAVAGAKPGDLWLATPRGFVDAGEAGIRVSGDFHCACSQVLNAANIQVQGNSFGVPVIVAPNIGALTSASNVAGASTKVVEPPATAGQGEQASIILVEFLGFGGAQEGSDIGNQRPQEQSRDPAHDRRSQNPLSAVQVVGAGELSASDMRLLTDAERSKLRSLSPDAR